MECVGEDVYLCVLPVDELAVHPDGVDVHLTETGHVRTDELIGDKTTSDGSPTRLDTGKNVLR